VLLAGVALVILRWEEFPIGAGMDDAYYIEMARSLAEGRGPVIHLGGIVPGWNPGVFPLGFSLLLSPLAWLEPGAVGVFRLVPILALAALFPLCHRLAHLGMSSRGLALAALVCLNPWTIGHATRVLSDLPFAALSLAAVLLYLHLADDPSVRWRPLLVLVVITVASIMVRSIGLALPLAMIICWIGNRRWPRALLLGTCVAAGLLPHALLNPEAWAGFITPAYLQQVFPGDEEIPSRVVLWAKNLFGYLRELPVVLLPVFGNSLQNAATRVGLDFLLGPVQLATGFFLAAGVVRGLFLLDRRDRTAARFLVLYLAVTGSALLNFAGFPSGVQTRLLIPLLPVLLLALLLALDQACGTRRGALFTPVVILMLAVSLGHNIFRVTRPLVSADAAPYAELVDPGLGADWIRNHTDPADVIMARWPLRQHIHFLRPVVGFGSVNGPELERRLTTFGVDYVFLGPGTPDERTIRLQSELLGDPRKFTRVYENTQTGVAVFRVLPVP
jgi:hypothetical protein